MSRRAANFDGLARGYRDLEFLAFGRDLERARFAHLAQLAACRSILILGEGDGRCLVRLLRQAPHAHFHCVDASPAMLARAATRVQAAGGVARVRFECADARTLALLPAAYDAVVTLFFLDCFTAPEVETLVARLTIAAQPGARWLFADFALPAAGPARWRARAWLALLYAFFRWRTRLSARQLPPSEQILARHGWSELAARTLQHGLLRSVALERSPSPSL